MAKITLTFDNGPDPEVTPYVLDVLAKRGIKSVFFVIGEKAAAHPELVRRAHNEGHWIGNHTYTHGTPFGELKQPVDAISEISETEKVIGSLARTEKLFRPFGGGGFLDRRLLNRDAVEYLRQHSYTCVIWNNVPRDFEKPNDWVSKALEPLQYQNWSVVVLHDFIGEAMRHLPEFLDSLEAGGHEIVQDFPADCMPIVGGKIMMDLEGWMPA